MHALICHNCAIFESVLELFLLLQNKLCLLSVLEPFSFSQNVGTSCCFFGWGGVGSGQRQRETGKRGVAILYVFGVRVCTCVHAGEEKR